MAGMLVAVASHDCGLIFVHDLFTMEITSDPLVTPQAGFGNERRITIRCTRSRTCVWNLNPMITFSGSVISVVIWLAKRVTAIAKLLNNLWFWRLAVGGSVLAGWLGANR